MAEKPNGMELLSTWMGEQGKDAMQMMQRMERLKRLMGTPKLPEKKEPVVLPKEDTEWFARNRSENMISAAIPFLDREYQKNLYLVVRLMEMRRVLFSEPIEARERQELPSFLRRRQMLGAVRPYLPHEEKEQLDMVLKIMDIREIMEREREL